MERVREGGKGKVNITAQDYFMWQQLYLGLQKPMCLYIGSPIASYFRPLNAEPEPKETSLVAPSSQAV